MLRVVEIFDGLEGEGVEVGAPSTFIRLAGCPLKCKTCDTKYSWSEGELLNPREVVSRVRQHRVVITGGEPLVQRRELLWLLELLLDRYTVLETSGVYYDEDVFNHVGMISADLKTPSSGLSQSILNRNLKVLHKICTRALFDVQVKAVCSNQEDLEYILKCYKELSSYKKPLVITPCWETKLNKKIAKEIAKRILEESLPYRVIVQQHKVIYGSRRRCV